MAEGRKLVTFVLHTSNQVAWHKLTAGNVSAALACVCDWLHNDVGDGLRAHVFDLLAAGSLPEDGVVQDAIDLLRDRRLLAAAELVGLSAEIAAQEKDAQLESGSGKGEVRAVTAVRFRCGGCVV